MKVYDINASGNWQSVLCFARLQSFFYSYRCLDTLHDASPLLIVIGTLVYPGLSVQSVIATEN